MNVVKKYQVKTLLYVKRNEYIVKKVEEYTGKFVHFKAVKDYFALFAVFGGFIDLVWKIFPSHEEKKFLKTISSKPPSVYDIVAKYAKKITSALPVSDEEAKVFLESAPVELRVKIEDKAAALASAHSTLLVAYREYIKLLTSD